MESLPARSPGSPVRDPFDLARHNVTSWPLVRGGPVALLLSLRTHVHPVLILFGGALVGAAL